MPYKEIDVECDLIICDNCEEGYCTYDGESSDLSPDEVDCQELHFNHFSKKVSRKQIEELKNYMEDKGIPFISINSESLHFQAIWVGPKKDFFGIVQGDHEDLQEFRFWKSVDGSIGCTHVDQLELEFS
jgi:hypothetical protein